MARPFVDELDQLSLQVEVLAVRVDQNLEEMRAVLADGAPEAAARALAADDEIDAMVVSLTQRCHDLLIREAPVARDSRLIVAVLRVLGELERIGDLALRVVKLGPDVPLILSSGASYDILVSMGDVAVEQYRMALRAWSTRDLDLIADLDARAVGMESAYDRLMGEVLRFDGAAAVRRAVAVVLAGRALERIGDHAVIIGARLQYLLTADPRHLAREVAPGTGGRG